MLPQLLRLWGCALLAALATWAVRLAWLGTGEVPRRLEAIVLLLVFAICYVLTTMLLRVPDATALWNRVRRRRTIAGS